MTIVEHRDRLDHPTAQGVPTPDPGWWPDRTTRKSQQRPAKRSKGELTHWSEQPTKTERTSRATVEARKKELPREASPPEKNKGRTDSRRGRTGPPAAATAAGQQPATATTGTVTHDAGTRQRDKGEEEPPQHAMVNTDTRDPRHTQPSRRLDLPIPIWQDLERLSISPRPPADPRTTDKHRHPYRLNPERWPIHEVRRPPPTTEPAAPDAMRDTEKDIAEEKRRPRQGATIYRQRRDQTTKSALSSTASTNTTSGHPSHTRGSTHHALPSDLSYQQGG